MKRNALFFSALAAAAVVLHAAGVEISGAGDAKWFEIMMPAPEGVGLYTYGTAAAEGKKLPIVIIRTPYVSAKRVDVASWATNGMGRTYMERGYALVVQHCRGCGMSEGGFVPYVDERRDGLALLDFVRKLPWYCGEIYLSGGSYLANVHFSYLDTDPPDVKGAALSVMDVNHYNISYRNGYFKIGLNGGWYIKQYMKKSLPNRKNVSEEGFREFPLDGFSMRFWGHPVESFDNIILHPLASDPFWQSSQPGSGIGNRNALAKSSMPVMIKTGFYDIFTDGICEMWRSIPEKRRANCALLIDAYDHGGGKKKKPSPTRPKGYFPNGSRTDEGVSDMDWFDSIRAGKPNTNAPAGKTRYYALWENVWHVETMLEDGSKEVRIPFGKGTRSYVYDPERKPPEFPGSGGGCFGGMKPQPKPDFRDDVVSFVLPAAEGQIDIRGRMEADLCVESDCEDTCFFVRVSIDKQDGNWYLLRDDIASLAFGGEPYTPGQRRVLRFRFADHAFRVEKGDRLRVDVASASPHFVGHPNRKGGVLSHEPPRKANNKVHAGASTLILHTLP